MRNLLSGIVLLALAACEPPAPLPPPPSAPPKPPVAVSTPATGSGQEPSSGSVPGAPAASSAAKAEDAYKDEHGHGKTPELFKQFVQLMEANNAEYKGIKQDVEHDKPEADIKKRLARIRENCAKADALKYRKKEQDAEDLERHFEIFSLKLKEFEEATWDTKDVRHNLLERLKVKCDVCHDDLSD